jgi:hypothetical protein
MVEVITGAAITNAEFQYVLSSEQILEVLVPNASG